MKVRDKDRDEAGQLLFTKPGIDDLTIPFTALRDPNLGLAAKGLIAELEIVGCHLDDVRDGVEGDERDLAVRELVEKGYLLHASLDPGD